MDKEEQKRKIRNKKQSERYYKKADKEGIAWLKVMFFFLILGVMVDCLGWA